MKLIQLSSSDVRFKPINFEDGLNIIVGQKILKNDKKKTSNGIGKSLSLICIDYLLGKGTQSKEIKKLKALLEKEQIILSLILDVVIMLNHFTLWNIRNILVLIIGLI